ncbi:MAG: DsbA family protein [Parvularculales bacterium]
MIQNRRYIIIGLIVIAVLIAGWAVWASVYFSPSISLQNSPSSGNGIAQVISTSTSPLETPGPLGDAVLGADDAPVTMVEYASLTCPHCGEFHMRTLPLIKEKYIDTGKVRLVFREYPFDPLATAGFIVALCAGEERYFGFIDLLFSQQNEWMNSVQPMASLESLARQGGFNAEEFRACLKDETLLSHVRDVQGRGQRELEVRSTPTFFINGEKVQGNRPYKELEAIIEQHLPEDMRDTSDGD